MARPSNASARRAQIVEAALRVIAQDGYAAATTAAIARAAGLASGLIHYHFKDKRSILLALVETMAITARNRFERLAEGADARGRVHAWIDARLALGPDAEPIAVAAWVMIGHEAVRDAGVREAYQSALQAELLLLQGLLDAAGVPTAQVQELAVSALAFAEGSFALASATRDLLPPGFAAGALKRLLDAAMSAVPGEG